MELNIIQSFVDLCNWMEISVIPYISNTINKYIDYKKDKELFSVAKCSKCDIIIHRKYEHIEIRNK